MKLSALLTSAGINIAFCILFLSLYSILRKQPGILHVYFSRQLNRQNSNNRERFSLERFVPSASWILKAWELTEDELIEIGGLDAAIFLRIFVFSIRIFAIAAVVCTFGVLPVNYFGQEMLHKQISAAQLDVFTIGNVKQGSRWLWVHCVALYIITYSACSLLHQEYKTISKMRLDHVLASHANPSHFSILVRAIPKSSTVPLDDTIRNFFLNYHGSSYLSHQIVRRRGKFQRVMFHAKKVYKKVVRLRVTTDDSCKPGFLRCGLCGEVSDSIRWYHDDYDAKSKNMGHADITRKECSAAFVFFKTRYGSLVASKLLQTSTPMIWVTDAAPEPNDVYWPNLWIPYAQIWIRQIASLLATILFTILFLVPVTFIQGLTQLEQLQQMLTFLKGIPDKAFVTQFVTGYLPSFILQLFLYSVPPMMMLFSTVEGSISRSIKKQSACCKILYFTIWNIFFVNVLSGSVISQLSVFSQPKDIPILLAKAVPRQATFFITYVLTLGWAGLASEVMQLYYLIIHMLYKYVLRSEEDTTYVSTFPYHTEVPKVLLFGLIGFTCSILAPLILPFLLVYFVLGYLVYRNQILNVYCTSYDSGGQMWPIVHHTTIFSLVLAQIIALGVFGTKDSSVASSCTIPLIISTLLFNEYCNRHFAPIFKNFSAQDFIEMDREDEQSGKMEDIHDQVMSAYCQLPPSTTLSQELCYDDSGLDIDNDNDNQVRI